MAETKTPTGEHGVLRGRMRSKLAAVGGIGLLVFLTASAGMAQAALVTLTPPYAAASITASPITWNTGAGSLAFPVLFATTTSGAAAIDAHATSGPGTGQHGSNGNEAGFNISYVCTGGCPIARTLSFNWGGTWYVSATTTGTGCTAKATFTVYGFLTSATGVVIVGGHVIVASVTAPPGGTKTGPMTAFVLAIPALTPGTTYHLTSYLYGYTHTQCGDGTAFAETDVGARFPVALNSVTLS